MAVDTSTPDALLSLAGNLVTAQDRAVASRALAAVLGARECLFFVRDTAVGQLLPAPGFQQTLPAAREWERFLAGCVMHGEQFGRLRYARDEEPVAACGLASSADVACVLLGCADSPTEMRTQLDRLRPLMPLIGAALIGERAVTTAQAQAAAARRVAEESRALAHVLDGTRRAVQHALAEAQDQRAQVLARSAELDAVLRALPDALVVYDADGTVARANDPARLLHAHIAGVPAVSGQTFDLGSALATAHVESVFSDADRLADGGSLGANSQVIVPDLLERALGGTSSAAHVILPRPGTTVSDRHLMINAAPISAGADQPISGAVLVVTDVTMLYALDQQKEEFLSIVSHELRTPLTTLKVMSEVLRRDIGSGNARQERSITSLQRAAHRLERLVNDLFNATRLETGALDLQLAPCDLREVCKQVVDEHRALTSHPIELEVGASPAWVLADADRISQVVINFLSNAVKYSPRGVPVTVRVNVTDGAVRVVVSDRGPGMAKDVQRRVFERFYRSRETPIQQGSGVGLGLGLFIAKRIVEHHGGAIGVESAPGKGTSFWFELAATGDQPAAAM